MAVAVFRMGPFCPLMRVSFVYLSVCGGLAFVFASLHMYIHQVPGTFYHHGPLSIYMPAWYLVPGIVLCDVCYVPTEYCDNPPSGLYFTCYTCTMGYACTATKMLQSTSCDTRRCCKTACCDTAAAFAAASTQQAMQAATAKRASRGLFSDQY